MRREPLVSSIEIARPPDAVYAFLTDPTRFAEWQSDVRGVRLSGDGPLEVGSRYDTIRRMGGAERAMTQEVTERDPGRTWAVRGVDGPIRPAARIVVAPLDGGRRAKVTFTLEIEGHGIGVPLVPAVRALAAKAAPHSYRKAKDILEGTA